jgi:hypothetical protein
MIDRRRFLLTSPAGALGAPLAVEAQPTAKVPRIGFLVGGSREDYYPTAEAFQQGLRDLGYVEGRNISIEYRFAEAERLEGQATHLVRFLATGGDSSTVRAELRTIETKLEGLRGERATNEKAATLP